MKGVSQLQYCSKVLLRNVAVVQRDFPSFRDFRRISSNLHHNEFLLKIFAKLLFVNEPQIL